MSFDPDLAGQLISRNPPLIVNAFGPTVEVLTTVSPDRSAPGLLRGTMPAGVVVPVHAHADPETFFVLSGQLEGLVVAADGTAEWITVETGQIFHVPPNARHALRNVGNEPGVSLIVTTPTMAKFFEKIGVEVPSVETEPRPPTPDDLQRMMSVSADFGYWNASPAENAELGVELPPPAEA